MNLMWYYSWALGQKGLGYVPFGRNLYSLAGSVAYRNKRGTSSSYYTSFRLTQKAKELGCVDIWCIMDTCQRLNYAMNNGRKSLNFCAHAQTSTLERRTIAGATSRPSCGWHEVVLLGDCCLSTTVTGTAYISASHAGVKRVYGNECISILCKTPIWSMSSLIAL